MIARFHYNDETLGQLLHDEIGEDQREVTEHVETCQQCQARLETISQDGMSWEQAGELLRDDSLDQQIDTSIEPVDSRAGRSFLQPTEHPKSIGRFGRYEIMEFLGRGGMGIVMRGFDPALNRHSAVKVLAPELAGSAAARKRFSREAKSAAAVIHPHVVPIQTVDEHDGLPYLVMPVVEGKSLQQRVDREGPLGVIEVVRISAQVAEGLAAAHGQGLVHRDIKPANILLENGVERVQITDFGLARAADDASLTRSGVIAGTPQYMSPEQAHGDEIDHRSDLFSLGSLMYFMLTGRSPFRAENTMGVLNRIANDQPRRLRAVNPEIPSWLQSIVTRLLQKNPDKRYATADAVAKELNGKLIELQNASSDSPSRETKFDRLWPPTLRGVSVAGSAAFAIWLAGLFLLQTDQGTIRIETNSAAAVPIRIRQGDEIVKRLTVDNDGASTRVRAGSYIIEIDGDQTSLELKDNKAVVKAKGVWVTRIEVIDRDLNFWKASRDPNQVRQLANDDRRHGRYEQALEKTLWYWDNAVSIRPSLSAVRRSFLLSDWLALGEVYPPALEKLRTTRDELKKRIISSDQVRVRTDDFGDFASVNRTLREESQTVELFRILDNTNPKDARRVIHWAKAALSKLNEQEILDKYTSALEGARRDASSAKQWNRERHTDDLDKYTWHFFGLRLEKATREAIRIMNQQVGATHRGAMLVRAVNANSPARIQDIRTGDLLLAINGIQTTDDSDMWAVIRDAYGTSIDSVKFYIVRDGVTLFGNSEFSQRNLIWQRRDSYAPPFFELYFPDDKEGGRKLDTLWISTDKDGHSDDEILATVRDGLRRTSEHRTSILRWIGNKYIWGQSPQNPTAIEIMYHAADFTGKNKDRYGTRHYAVYFGLSVTKPKSPSILRTLAELCVAVDDPNDLSRVAWGASDQREELISYLTPFLISHDAAVREKAETCRRIFAGEVKAFDWAKEQAQQRGLLRSVDGPPDERRIDTPHGEDGER